jgi:hypothetical protein
MYSKAVSPLNSRGGLGFSLQAERKKTERTEKTEKLKRFVGRGMH